MYKFNIKFKARKLIISVNNIQHNLKISIMFFDDLIIIIIKTLLNNHANFEFDNINKKLKIVENQSIDDIFVSFNIIDNEF